MSQQETPQDFRIHIFCGDHEVAPRRSLPPVWETCLFCEAKFDLNNLHPGLQKQFGSHPQVCRSCGICFAPYARIWSDDLVARIVSAKAHAGEARTCRFCGRQYNLLGSLYRRAWYRDLQHPGLNETDGDPIWGGYVARQAVDFLYPNLYTEICPECFRGLFWQHLEREPSDQLAAVRELGERLGKLPARDFASYIYAYQDKEKIEWFLGMLKRLPDPDLINARFGSYFKLLLSSGLLPEGTRRMRLGTWTLAKDGDMCFSLVERDIDDWLTKHGIEHTKEVRYPGSDMRCDWEVFDGDQRIFIEYFGLMNQKTYAAKAELKRQIAASNKIRLVGITPDMDWEKSLGELFSRTAAESL